jgi:hypothetical protein
MGQFVKQHEQHVAGYEFRQPLEIFRGQVLELRVVAKRQGRRIDPGLQFSRVGPNRRFRRGR